MQFYSGYFLNLLWLVPVLVLCFVASGWINAKRIGVFLKTPEIRKKLLPHYRPNEWPIRAVFLLAAFILSVLALSQPQWGEEKRKIERKGVDLIFMLDVSTSMLAEDIKPSRIQKTRFEIESFVKALKGDRIGLLTFAGSSFMQTPLTLDYSAFMIFLEGVDVGHVPDPGTSMGPAIRKAIEAFPTEEKGQYRALVIFSDGEDHDVDIGPAIELAQKKNVRIYTVGTATAEGAPIPLRDETGQQTAVKKDRAGQIVITKLNKELLQKVATQTGGIYLQATPGEREVDVILRHMSSLGEKKLEDRTITEREDHFQNFVFFAFLFLILEMLVRRGKSARALPLSALLFIFFIHSGFMSTPQKTIDEGNDDFQNKRYQSAVDKYREVQVKNPDSPPVEYNLATSLYKLDQYQESAAHLKNALEKSDKDPHLKAKAAYNYGNALYRIGDYDGAVNAYKKALELDPNDKDSKYNLEFIQNKKSKAEKENQDRKKDSQKNQNNKNQQQNQQKNNPNQQNSQNQQNQQNQGGGGGSDQNQNKNQGQDNKQNQQGSGQGDQKQNQGGQGQNQQGQSGGKSQDQNKDQNTDQNQPQNQDKQNQSGGSGQKDQKKDQSQGQDKNQQQNQKQNSDQQNQSGGSGQTDQQKNQNQGQGQKDSSEKQDEQQNQPGQTSKPNPDQNNPNQPGEGQNKSDQKPPQPPETSGQAGSGTGHGASSNDTAGSEKGTAMGQTLQGEMNKKDAENLLASLEDGEKKFHILRKPEKEQSSDAVIEKDW